MPCDASYVIPMPIEPKHNRPPNINAIAAGEAPVNEQLINLTVVEQESNDYSYTNSFDKRCFGLGIQEWTALLVIFILLVMFSVEICRMAISISERNSTNLRPWIGISPEFIDLEGFERESTAENLVNSLANNTK